MDVQTVASQVFRNPLASIVYHLLLLLAVEAALGMAWGEWRRSRRDQAQRLLFAMGGLLLLRAAHLATSLVASTGWIESWALLPPIEAFVDTASICLLGWAFMPPARRGVRTWDLVFGAILVVAVGVCVGFTMDWARVNPSTGSLPDYNDYWQSTVWLISQIFLAILLGVAVLRNRDDGWEFMCMAAAAFAIGGLLQLFAPFPVDNISAWGRISNLLAYSLLVAAVYQGIVIRLRAHSRDLQDISQASMDQIKSLLYLSEAGQQMSASLDLPMVLDSAVKGISRALDADQCAIAFPDESDAGQMRLVAIHNPVRQGRGEGVTFPLDYQLAVQHAMRRRKYVISDELDNVQLKVLFALLGSSEVGPLMVQPLVDGITSIGAIIVGNSRARRPFTPNEAKLCQSMSEQLVIAIRNARRYQAAQARVQEFNKQLSDRTQVEGESKQRVQSLQEQLAEAQAKAEEYRAREELACEARNALEIRLASTRAEVDTIADHIAVLETDLNQAHANAEAQLRFHREELARREARWREDIQAAQWIQIVLQGMTSGVLIANVKGMIREANVAAELLLEKPGDELRSLSLADVSTDHRWRQAVVTASGGEAVRLTTQVGANTLLVDMAPLEAEPGQGRVIGIVTMLQDITAETEAQRTQLASVITMASELRTPTTAVLNYVDLLLSEVVGTVGEEQHKFLSRIRDSAGQIIQMIADLTREATDEEQWSAPQRKLVDVADLIEQIVSGSIPLFEDKSLTVDLDLSEDLPIIEADPDHLHRVLTSLLSNACLASSEGAQIEVRVSQSDGLPGRSSLMEVNGNGYVVLSVKDAGGGLSEDARNRVFDRARPSRTPPGLGESGAGLALVKTLIEAHGGRMWVESEDGVGTTFRVVLPVNEPHGLNITAARYEA